MKIYVDADGFPKSAKDILIRAAIRHDVSQEYSAKFNIPSNFSYLQIIANKVKDRPQIVMRKIPTEMF
ncbi:MAG: hypothetical protein PHW04_07075 [Candidatus Wallbacteria bacterium]|nr:hypothetical protein [Candidatus Wallbacteria bacterium]